VNGQQCDGAVNSVMSVDPLIDKLRSFGAEAVAVDGHDIFALLNAARISHKEKPLVVLCRTDPCRCMPELKIHGGKLHYIRIKSEVERSRYVERLAAL
jgi:transketolase